MGLAIGVDVGGTKLAAGVVDDQGRVLARLRRGTPAQDPGKVEDLIADCIRELAADHEVEAAGLGAAGFMRRFDPGHLELESALEAGACGAPLLVHCISSGVASAPGSTSESSVTGSAIHEFDIVPGLLDAPVVEVSWQALRAAGAVAGMQDPQLILLRTADGVLATVEVFLNAGSGYDIRCEIVGDRGTIALTNPARVVADADRRRATGYPADWRPRSPTPTASSCRPGSTRSPPATRHRWPAPATG
jgi:myo-inositol 2-dehydrogenase/D-chiro-inositol 1-dehydrogenase